MAKEKGRRKKVEGEKRVEKGQKQWGKGIRAAAGRVGCVAGNTRRMRDFACRLVATDLL